MKNLYKEPYKRSYEKGFTLIEILVAIAISGIVMAGIYSAYYSQHKSYVVQEQVAVAQQNIRAAMYFMEREIRMAGCDPEGNAGAGIIVALEDTIQFTEDIGDGSGGDDPNGTIDPVENITYTLDGSNNLTRTTGAGTQTIAQDIQDLSFSYFNAAGGTASTPENVRSVQITLSAGTGTNQRSMTARVKCRNIGLDEPENI